MNHKVSSLELKLFTVLFQALCSNEKDDPGGASLYGHKIVLLSPKRVEGGAGVILGTITLQNHRLSPTGYFTIGGVILDEMYYVFSFFTIQN